MHRAHHAREHRAVADAGVEDADCRRARVQMRKLLGDAVRHLPLFAAGVDEQQIFLPVVEEAEIALRVRLARTMRGRGGGRRHAERVNSARRLQRLQVAYAIVQSRLDGAPVADEQP